MFQVLHETQLVAQHGGLGHPGGAARLVGVLLHDLLRQEIGAGIDSGPEFARDRLKLQVEVLQSSLKSGQGGRAGQGGAAAELRALVAMPALVDARTASRIEQLALRVAKEGK
jgi:hypothetical protein